MKHTHPVPRSGSLALRRLGFIPLLLFLTLLVAGLALVLSLARQNSVQRTSAASGRAHAVAAAGPTAGLYVGSGDGALYKLDTKSGATLWHFSTQGSSIPAAPVVVNGTVYLGSAEGIVYALNAATGVVRWQFSTHGAILATPAVVNGVVYVGSSDSYVYALNATTGARLWRYDAGPTSVAVTPGALVVLNGVVYGSASDNVAHSYLYALHAASGAQLWQKQIHNQAFTNLQVSNGAVYIASWSLKQQGGPDVTDSYVYAFNAQDGAQLWRSDKIGDFVVAAPAVANGVVYIGSRDTYLYALNAQTGKQVWRAQAGGAISSSPVVINGAIYAGVYSEAGAGAPTKNSDTSAATGSVVVLNTATGARLWQRALANYTGSQLAVFAGMVYAGAEDNTVHALNATSGTEVWSQQMAAGVTVISNNAPMTVAP